MLLLSRTLRLLCVSFSHLYSIILEELFVVPCTTSQSRETCAPEQYSVSDRFFGFRLTKLESKKLQFKTHKKCEISANYLESCEVGVSRHASPNCSGYKTIRHHTTRFSFRTRCSTYRATTNANKLKYKSTVHRARVRHKERRTHNVHTHTDTYNTHTHECTCS